LTNACESNSPVPKPLGGDNVPATIIVNGALRPLGVILAPLWARKEAGEGKGVLRPQEAGPEVS
jgi:hypothetical protein